MLPGTDEDELKKRDGRDLHQFHERAMGFSHGADSHVRILGFNVILKNFYPSRSFSLSLTPEYLAGGRT